MKTLLLATNNAKKAKELQELSASSFLVKRLGDVGLDVDVVEDAPDFRGNAWKKAREVAAAASAKGVSYDVVVADDSGLCVDALDGHPGVRSARFAKDAGTGAGDDANNKLLLLLLHVIPDERRTARFLSVVVALGKDGAAHEAQGTVEGRIARDLSGAGGFGYDPLFIVDEGESAGRRMAELTAEQKHAISHRGKAMRALLQKLGA